jgi:hypothetical protein
VKELNTSGREFRRARGNELRSCYLELEEHLRYRAVLRPDLPAEARSCGLGERPDAEVPAALQPLAVQEVRSRELLQPEANGIDEERLALR